MNGLNTYGSSLVSEIELALKYKQQVQKSAPKTHRSASTLAFAYEKARNAVEYRDEHLIRQAAIERILKRRLFLNQSSLKIANLLVKELIWARYTDTTDPDIKQIEKFKGIIEKYREALKLVKDSSYSATIIGLCACEIDEILNFNPINQIIINFVAASIESRIEFKELDQQNKYIQIYIATERSFSKNSEILIKYKLLKVLLPKWNDVTKLIPVLTQIEGYTNYRYKNILRRKVAQMAAPFNLIRDLSVENSSELLSLTEDKEKLKLALVRTLEAKYNETKTRVANATIRSIIYIFLTKMVLAILIEIPIDLLFGKINYLVLGINIIFPPSLMVLFSARVKSPSTNNTVLLTEKVINYLYQDETSHEKEEIKINVQKSLAENIFNYIFLVTSVALVIGIVYLLNLLSFSMVNKIIFLFFLSVVSFFAFRIRDISDDYLLSEAENDSFFETLLDYIFLPIIKSGQWLSTQISKINVLSFIFDFIIEAPLKSFLEILEQWLHFVRVKKEEFLG